MRRATVAGLLVVAACAARVPPPPSLPPPPTAGLTVTLGWSGPVDLDLYVTDPALETVYYANPRTRSGGVLERDARCADGATATRVERARWTEPPPGRYRVGVDFPEACAGRSAEASFRLAVQIDERSQETTGRVRLTAREPRVLEFTVPEREVRR